MKRSTHSWGLLALLVALPSVTHAQQETPPPYPYGGYPQPGYQPQPGAPQYPTYPQQPGAYPQQPYPYPQQQPGFPPPS